MWVEAKLKFNCQKRRVDVASFQIDIAGNSRRLSDIRRAIGQLIPKGITPQGITSFDI